jgi:hypothetical protein
VAGFRYSVGRVFAGEPVEVVATGGLVEIRHAGVLVATRVQRRHPDPERAAREHAAADWRGSTPRDQAVLDH